MKSLAKWVKSQLSTTQSFTDSKSYWERRYLQNGNSGDGSHGRLAVFKADFLNTFVKINNIRSIIEWGSGDGDQLQLAQYPFYVGVDVSPSALKLCRKKFAEDTTKTFYNYEEAKKLITKNRYELSLSLDVIFHLVEDPIFEDYMHALFMSSKKYVIVYSSNSNKMLDAAPHVKHRLFTKWVKNNYGSNWKLVKTVKNKYPLDMNDSVNTSFADFYVFEKLKA